MEFKGISAYLDSNFFAVDIGTEWNLKLCGHTAAVNRWIVDIGTEWNLK